MNGDAFCSEYEKAKDSRKREIERESARIFGKHVSKQKAGLLLLILDGHMWDCSRNAKIALRFSFTENSESAWRPAHRFAGCLWLAAGLLVIAGTMATSTIITAALILVALAAPVVYGQSMRNHVN